MGDDAPRTFRLTDCVTLLAEDTSASMEAEERDHGEEEAEMDEHCLLYTSPCMSARTTRPPRSTSWRTRSSG